MIKRIEKSLAEGEISAPSSKSAAHRMLIAAAMCKDQKSIIRGITPCEDVLATIDCLKALGVKIEYDGDVATIWGIDFTKAIPKEVLDCRESGSTLRFLIPIAMLSGNEVKFSGSKRLWKDPRMFMKVSQRNGDYTLQMTESISLSRGPLRQENTSLTEV